MVVRKRGSGRSQFGKVALFHYHHVAWWVYFSEVANLVRRKVGECFGASLGNIGGIFDAAYDFGGGKADTEMSGTPEEVGAAVAHYLFGLFPED